MVLSYRGNSFDTALNLSVRYRNEAELRRCVDGLLHEAGEGNTLPSVIGIVSRDFPFISNLSIIENIILPLEYHAHLREREAVGMIAPLMDELDIRDIADMRKENVSGTGLFRAMFLRAVALDPEAVFIADFKYSMSSSEFSGMLPLLRKILAGKSRLWIGMDEGHVIEWDHDAEVVLER